MAIGEDWIRGWRGLKVDLIYQLFGKQERGKLNNQEAEKPRVQEFAATIQEIASEERTGTE